MYFTSRDERGRFIAAKHANADVVREVYRPQGDVGASDSSVSPDGQWLAFSEGGGTAGTRRLRVMPIGGGTVTDVYQVPPPDGIPAFGGINWMKDSRSLFFVRASGPTHDRRELWRVGVDGSAPKKVGLSMRGMNDVRLHPDGRRVAFTARDGYDEVWALERLFDSVHGAKP